MVKEVACNLLNYKDKKRNQQIDFHPSMKSSNNKNWTFLLISYFV